MISQPVVFGGASPALDYKFVVNSVDPDEAVSPRSKETEPDFVPASDRSENMVPEHGENGRDPDEDAEEDASSLMPLTVAENGAVVNSTGNHLLDNDVTALFCPDAGVVIIGNTHTHTGLSRQPEEKGCIVQRRHNVSPSSLATAALRREKLCTA